VNLIEIIFATHDNTKRHKETLLRYNSHLSEMQKSYQQYLIAIYLGSDEGPAITSIAYLAMADMAAFMRFNSYLNGVAADMIEEIGSGARKVGGKHQASATIESMQCYARLLHKNGMEVAASPEYNIDLVLDYTSVVICFLHLYRCCMEPDEVLDHYDGTWLRGWLSACGIPLIQPLVLSATSFH
jgi:hypothetical protein